MKYDRIYNLLQNKNRTRDRKNVRVRYNSIVRQFGVKTELYLPVFVCN